MNSREEIKQQLINQLTACMVLLLVRYEDGWSTIETAFECAVEAVTEPEEEKLKSVLH